MNKNDSRIKANVLTEELLEISGDKSEQVSRLRGLTYIYSKPFSFESVAINLVYDRETINITNKTMTIGETTYTPQTLSDFISICTSRSIPVYWDYDTYTEYIDYRTKK